MSRMRVLLAGLVIAVLVIGVMAAPPAGAETRAAADCAARLECTVANINNLSMSERVAFVRAMEAGPAAELGLGEPHRWRNIEGIIGFFADYRLGPPGSWVSYVDCGILEGIERGLAIALGKSSDTRGNPGSRLWASYLTRLASGQLASRAVHDKAWGDAEQASTDYGVQIAGQHGLQATGREMRLFEFSEFYRFSLRNRPALLDLIAVYGPLINPNLTNFKVPFVDWFTDVTISTPIRKGAEFAWNYAGLDLLPGTVTMADLLLAYGPVLYQEFRNETGLG